MTYIPQGFRGTLIRQQRERSERNRQAEVDALVNSGGTIHDRYNLLWRQQMDRRNQLAQLGSATGVYKTLVKYLVGVPQVLLDFICQINDDQGEVFSNSPFFIKAEDAGALESKNNDDYKEIIIPAGKTHEDIGFRIEYVSPSGGTTSILPYRRYESDQGNFSTIFSGSYKLIWDNSYSTFFKKSLRYKVDAIPPVSDTPEPVQS